mmetsp:Transcript_70/g.138  ORF Transcript_70/g.138 Transcript_70/m.138 type:complete len:251 (-) Transcript_70:337-1089(-)
MRSISRLVSALSYIRISAISPERWPAAGGWLAATSKAPIRNASEVANAVCPARVIGAGCEWSPSTKPSTREGRARTATSRHFPSGSWRWRAERSSGHVFAHPACGRAFSHPQSGSDASSAVDREHPLRPQAAAHPESVLAGVLPYARLNVGKEVNRPPTHSGGSAPVVQVAGDLYKVNPLVPVVAPAPPTTLTIPMSPVWPGRDRVRTRTKSVNSPGTPRMPGAPEFALLVVPNGFLAGLSKPRFLFFAE